MLAKSSLFRPAILIVPEHFLVVSSRLYVSDDRFVDDPLAVLALANLGLDYRRPILWFSSAGIICICIFHFALPPFIVFRISKRVNLKPLS